MCMRVCHSVYVIVCVAVCVCTCVCACVVRVSYVWLDLLCVDILEL